MCRACNMNHSSNGRIVVIGAGLTAISHLTIEALSHVRHCDVVYHYGPDTSHAFLRCHNRNVIDVHALFEREKLRRYSYVQMAELALEDARTGARVGFVFQGHPALLNFAVARMFERAEIEKIAVTLVPGVSSADALIADFKLNVDEIGCQIVKAHALLTRRLTVLLEAHVIILMGGGLGDPTGATNLADGDTKPRLLFQRLIDWYGPDHRAFLYWGRVAPTDIPKALRISLASAASDARVDRLPPHWTLYVPPKEQPPQLIEEFEALGLLRYAKSNQPHDGTVSGYGELDLDAIEGLPERRGALRERQPDTSDANLKINIRAAEDPGFIENAPWLSVDMNNFENADYNRIYIGDDIDLFCE